MRKPRVRVSLGPRAHVQGRRGFLLPRPRHPNCHRISTRRLTACGSWSATWPPPQPPAAPNQQAQWPQAQRPRAAARALPRQRPPCASPPPGWRQRAPWRQRQQRRCSTQRARPLLHQRPPWRETALAPLLPQPPHAPQPPPQQPRAKHQRRDPSPVPLPHAAPPLPQPHAPLAAAPARPAALRARAPSAASCSAPRAARPGRAPPAPAQRARRPPPPPPRAPAQPPAPPPRELTAAPAPRCSAQAPCQAQPETAQNCVRSNHAARLRCLSALPAICLCHAPCSARSPALRLAPPPRLPRAASAWPRLRPLQAALVWRRGAPRTLP